jgi:hypothetical protein
MVFGTAHLGAIRGLVAAFSVGSIAIGLLLFALVHDTTGSYSAVLAASALLPLAVAASTVLVRLPHTVLPSAPTA